MGRVIAIGPGGKAQAPVRDDRAHNVIEWVVTSGRLDQLYRSPACEDYEEAYELRTAIYRSARYYCSCNRPFCSSKYGNIPGRNKVNPEGGCPRGGQRISARADVVIDDDGVHYVEFTLHDKRAAMQVVIDRYGPDPNDWPYNPRAKRKKED